MTAPTLFTHPIHLGLGATARVKPAFTGMDWYDDYVTRNAADGAEGLGFTRPRPSSALGQAGHSNIVLR